MDVRLTSGVNGLNQQMAHVNVEVDRRLQQCFQQFLNSLEASMQALIQEISLTRNVGEAEPIIRVYQGLIIWAKNAAISGYVEFAQKAEEVRRAIMNDQFAVIDKALEVRRELLRQEAELQMLLIQRNNEILKAQAEAIAANDQKKLCHFQKARAAEEAPRDHHGRHRNHEGHEHRRHGHRGHGHRHD